MDRKQLAMINAARLSIMNELDRAFKGHKRVIIRLVVPRSGRYTIDGFIKVLNPVSMTVECEGEDGLYTETFFVNHVRVVSVFE